MSHHTKPSVFLNDVSFSWPDGDAVFSGITATFGTGRTGLIGTNGAGKTTLLRLITRELTPTSGSIASSGDIGYLPQKLILEKEATAASLLGIEGKLMALKAIESGDVSSSHFDTIGDDWDIESSARALLDGIGLNSISLDRTVGTLSGGESMLVALAGLEMAGMSVILLDEPTNNLDRESRRRLYEVIESWPGALIVVSHDVALLNLMDETAELHAGGLTVYGGGYHGFQEYRAKEQVAAQQALRNAQQTLKMEQKQRVEAETKLARRGRYAQTAYENKREPRAVMKLRKRDAQVSAGRLRGGMDDDVETARQLVEVKEALVRKESQIIIDLPDPLVPGGRILAEFRNPDGQLFQIRGPERVALTGRNGIGKTRLLERLLQHSSTREFSPQSRIDTKLQTELVGYLPQRDDYLDDDATILEFVSAAAPTVSMNEVRSRLARFLFRADAVRRRVGDLSGGERFRVALAALLLAEPPNQLLILDEPTNNLDLSSVDELVSALSSYRGGLLVVSHDDEFLTRLNLGTWLELGIAGLVRLEREM